MTQFIENQPVIIAAWEGPLPGTYVGTRINRMRFAPDGFYLRVKVAENPHGYEVGKVLDVLPQHVTAADVEGVTNA